MTLKLLQKIHSENYQTALCVFTYMMGRAIPISQKELLRPFALYEIKYNAQKGCDKSLSHGRPRGVIRRTRVWTSWKGALPRTPCLSHLVPHRVLQLALLLFPASGTSSHTDRQAALLLRLLMPPVTPCGGQQWACPGDAHRKDDGDLPVTEPDIFTH